MLSAFSRDSAEKETRALHKHFTGAIVVVTAWKLLKSFSLLSSRLPAFQTEKRSSSRTRTRKNKKFQMDFLLTLNKQSQCFMERTFLSAKEFWSLIGGKSRGELNLKIPKAFEELFSNSLWNDANFHRQIFISDLQILINIIKSRESQMSWNYSPFFIVCH